MFPYVVREHAPYILLLLLVLLLAQETASRSLYSGVTNSSRGHGSSSPGHGKSPGDCGCGNQGPVEADMIVPGPGKYEWAAYIPEGQAAADAVARDHGYDNLGQIGSLEGYYLMRQKPTHHRVKREASHHTRILLADRRVDWAEEQRAVRRDKRELILKREAELAYREVNYDDALWNGQWYLHDANKSSKLDLRVIPVWAKNFTGSGVVVSILDDGLEHNHTDIIGNYDPDASYDLNDNDTDPFPRYDWTNENKHGTRCAGEVAMAANNKICGVGVAYNAKIGGIRILDGTVTDSIEARAITHNIQHIDIFSASWGPTDDGKTMEGPGRLTSAALEKGIFEGRGGKGVIYVWASGNGGRSFDNCDCDGYIGSIYTIAISGATEHGKAPWYNERCAAVMATAYSSGMSGDRSVVSADLHNQCTLAATGTSAAAPIAAGIFALILEVNPHLTWRDLQHLIVWTSEYGPLRDNPGWARNGAGLWFNNLFGFGLLNAEALANAADKTVFKAVPPKNICTFKLAEDTLPTSMTSQSVVELSGVTDGCKDTDNEINHIEHVIVTLNMTYSNRGKLIISLTSPSGTETVLLTERPKDSSSSGFKSWPFMSVNNWSERPQGTWAVRFVDNTTGKEEGMINSLSITLHGTREMPDHVARQGSTRTYRIEDYDDDDGDEEDDDIDDSEKIVVQRLDDLLVHLNKQRNLELSMRSIKDT